MKLDGSDARVYVIIGDGEQAEGQIWEAAMAASAYKADNLCAILDYNKLQATDATDRILPIGNLKEKWGSFGWHVIDIDGHDAAAILAALDEAKETKGAPTMIIARTVKGKGFPFAENLVKYHNGAISEQEQEQALEAIRLMREAL